MAYHYQEFILGLPGAQPVPMMDVVIALDLSGEGAISDYKKQLQGLIWNERGHSRNLADYLYPRPAHPGRSRGGPRAAAPNERTGKSEWPANG